MSNLFSRILRRREAGDGPPGNTSSADAWIARAAALADQGRHREAFDVCAMARLSGVEGGEADLEFVLACISAGRLDDAEQALTTALAAAPDSWRLHFESGRVGQARRRYRDAIVEFERALLLNPGHFHGLNNCGICLVSIGDGAAAETMFRECIAIDERSPKAWANLSIALSSQGRHEEALDAICHAGSLPDEDGAKLDLFFPTALYLADLGRNTESLELLEARLPSIPEQEAHYLYAHVLLLLGRWAEGWAQNEFRWMVEPLLSLKGRINAPVWRGQDLRGKTILIRPEQGIGDMLLFIRYAPIIKALGPRVLLQSWRGFGGIDARIPGIDLVIPQGDPLPAFDYWIQLMSVPAVFGATAESVPNAVPYLAAEPDRVARWQPTVREHSALKVGLVWAGNPEQANDRRRSMSLSRLLPLLEVEGVDFFALQKGPREAEADTLAKGKPLTNLGPELRDLGDTAAVMTELDLVISVCTSMAHLAGALGKPVWVLLSEPADWRWLTGREDSPWYPTARLFRQRRRGEWGEVIERVREALQEWVATGGKAPALPAHATPTLKPRAGLAPRRIAGLSAVTEARVGIVQYFPDDEPMGSSLEWYGEWLQGQLEVVLRWVRKGGVGMEVGAGVGAHAIALGEGLGPEGHLFLYEGRPVVRRVLTQNLGANRIGNVTVMRRRLGGPGGGEGTETLDELQLERLDWLKVNAPEVAQEILAGGEQTLWRLRPRLMLGVATQAELDALAEQVKGYGYRCWRMETPLYDAANFNRRDDDIFAGRTALALVAMPEESDTGLLVGAGAEL
jgi:tetratricopeptide (TPR) repeat protein